MMITVHGYEPIGDQPIPDGQIIIAGWFSTEEAIPPHVLGEDHKDWERRAGEKFQTEAQGVYDVLSNNLPGGTLHRLLILMLQGQLNLFVVKE